MRIVLAVLLPLVAGSTLRIPVVQDDIKFNAVDSIKSSQVGDVLSALNGYTVHSSDPWKGLRAYNPLRHPTLFLVANFELPKGLSELTMNSNLKFELENDNQLDDEFNEFKARSARRWGEAEGRMVLVDADEESEERLKEAQTLLSDEKFDVEKSADRAFLLEYYTFKNVISDAAKAPVNGAPSTAYWINLNSLKALAADYDFDHKKTQRALQLFSQLVGAATGQLESHPRSLFMVIQASGEPRVRMRRELTIQANDDKATEKDAGWNLATRYNVEFHVVFGMTAFTLLVFVLGVYATSIGLWFMDPGRDSIIYRMTSQRMKME